MTFKFYTYFWTKFGNFYISHTVLPLTVTKLSTVKIIPVFLPTVYLYTVSHYSEISDHGHVRI